MYQRKKYTDSMSMEQGVEISVELVEHTKTDYDKPWGDPNREVPDGTYEITVDLSESDVNKFANGITINLPDGGIFECSLEDGGGWYRFTSSNGNGFYTEYDN